MDQIHILTKVARFCQTSGFQWKALSFSNFSSWSDPSRLWITAHMQWCITTSAHSQAPTAFLSSFSTSDFWNNPSKQQHGNILPLQHYALITVTSTPMMSNQGLMAVFKLQLTRILPFLQYNQQGDLHVLWCSVCVKCTFLWLECYNKLLWRWNSICFLTLQVVWL